MMDLDDKIDKLKISFEMGYFEKSIEITKSIQSMIKRIIKRKKRGK